MNTLATLALSVLVPLLAATDDMTDCPPSAADAACCAHPCPIAVTATRAGRHVVDEVPVAVVTRDELLA